MSQKFTITDSLGGLAVCGLENPPREIVLAPRPAPGTRWNVQSVHPLRADGHAFGRGGGLMTLEWTVARTHASYAAAQLFLRDHAGEIPQLGLTHLAWELNGTIAKSSGALSTLSWDRARCLGVRTVCTYQWTGTMFAPGGVGAA